MNNIINKALNYVSKHIDEDYLDYLSSKASAMRCPISLIDPIIADTVYDLLEEFGEDHELPENYWMEFGDIDDIMNEL